MEYNKFINQTDDILDIFKKVEDYKNSEKGKQDKEKLDEFLKNQGKLIDRLNNEK